MVAATGIRGSTTGKLVAGLVLLGLVAGAAWRLREPAASADGVPAGDWGAARIEGEPAAFLDACESEARALLDAVAAQEATRQEVSAGLQATRAAAAASLKDLEDGQETLKAAFVVARAESSWPLEWRSLKLDEKGVQENLQRLSQQQEHEREKLAKLDTGLEGLTQRATQLAQVRAQAERQLALIPSLRTRLSSGASPPAASELMPLGSALDEARTALEREGAPAETP